MRSFEIGVGDMRLRMSSFYLLTEVLYVLKDELFVVARCFLFNSAYSCSEAAAWFIFCLFPAISFCFAMLILRAFTEF